MKKFLAFIAVLTIFTAYGNGGKTPASQTNEQPTGENAPAINSIIAFGGYTWRVLDVSKVEYGIVDVEGTFTIVQRRCLRCD